MLLAGDVGGTKTNLALCRLDGGAFEMVAEEQFLNHGRAGLEEIVRAFLAARGARPEAACFAVAGPVDGERVEMTNLHWTLDARAMAAAFGIPRVALLNDLEANAHGIATLGPAQYAVLNPGRPRAGTNAALIAAGTGLGEAIMFWDGTRWRVSASEGGHTDFAPRGDAQAALLARLAPRFDHVSYERLVSGPGLQNIYDALDGAEPPAVAERLAAAADRSAVISAAALAGESARCGRALDLFVAVYGAEAGNLALKALARAGMWVGGGIAPKILPKLQDGAFLRAFCDKGRFADLLRDIPLKVILEPRTALRGAAAYLAGLEVRA